MDLYQHTEMFFIVGRGRSGTTLLNRLLNAHSTVSVAPESLFIMNTFYKYRDKLWNKSTIDSFSKDIWQERRMQEWNINQEDLRLWLHEHCLDTSFSYACKLVYANHALHSNKPHATLFGDKNPHYSLFTSQLAGLYPKSKFIYLVRDYRDNIASYRNVSFDSNNIATLAYRWRFYNKCVTDTAQKYPDRFLTIRYEDLTADPESTLSEICSFLGIPFESSMLAQSQETSHSQVAWHKNLDTPVNNQQTNKWKQALTIKQSGSADTICQPLAQSFQYQPASTPMPALCATDRLGILQGYFLTKLEISLFHIPITLRSYIIRLYRFLNGTHKLSGGRKH